MDTAGIKERLLSGERRALAQAITLVESSRPEDRERAGQLLADILPLTGNSLRIGISGVPGAGKSTFIESFGQHWIGQGHRVAVLAVDPSSSQSGGSILGDKTRMQTLSAAPAAFIRPSPSGDHSGGVNRSTRESILLCEAAGYDVILVETVGVGQAEIAVHSMTDLFLLIMLPNTGDELQGIKKGVLELADLVIVNKADIDPAAAGRARAELKAALHLRQTAGEVPVILTSALHNEGLSELMASLKTLRDPDRIAHRRQGQQLNWFQEAFARLLRQAVEDNSAIQEYRSYLKKEIASAGLLPEEAAARLFHFFVAEEARRKENR